MDKAVEQFEIGGGAHILFYTDVEAATVVALTDKAVTVQVDKAQLLNGVRSGEPDALQFSPGGFVGHTSGTQRYLFEADPDAAKQVFTLRKNGKWIAKGQPMNGQQVKPGRYKFYDYNF